MARILKDYESLQSNIHDILKDQEQAKEEKENHASSPPSDRHHQSDDRDQLLVSLSLGRASSNDDDGEPRKSVEKKIGNESNNNSTKVFDKLALGLGSSSSTSHSADHDRDDQAEPTEIWPPSKVLKRSSDQEDGVSQMSPLKKARVSVRTRCDTPTVSAWHLKISMQKLGLVLRKVMIYKVVIDYCEIDWHVV